MISPTTGKNAMPHADPTAGASAAGASAAGALAAGALAAGALSAGASAGPGNPTPEPPDGADPLLWRLAYGLHRDHRPDVDGSCVTCRTSFPCPPRGLADRGFAAAMVPREAPSG